ncbi:MAG: HTTM domain-containing protein [Bacteroidia bacterium]
MNLASNIYNLTQPSQKVTRTTLLRKLLFGYIILSFFQLIPLIDTLYNPQQSLIATQSLHQFTVTTCVNLLSVDAFKNYYLVFIAVQVIAAFVGLMGFFPRIMTFIVFFVTLNLQNRIYSTLTGGDYLLCLMLFYLSFISDGRKSKNKYVQEITNVSDHTFILLCQLQLVIVYAVSAIYKWQSVEWTQGIALQKILLINEYSIPYLQNMVCEFPVVFKLFTWMALLYQTLFPVLIFSKRLKKYVIITGIIFHLFIAIAMGLFNFSLVMICCYALFYDVKLKQEEEHHHH